VQVCPQFSLAAIGQQLTAYGATSGRFGGTKSSGGGSGAASSSSGSGGGGAAGKSRAPTSGDGRQPARHMGLAVCYGYNNKDGCRRLAAGQTAAKCQDGNTAFAHVCNYWHSDRKAHCLASHPRYGNH